jgi:hypothetical protein
MGFMLLIALALTKGGAYHAKRVMVLTLLQNEMSFFFAGGAINCIVLVSFLNYYHC